MKTSDKKGVRAYDFLDIWETCANSRGMNYSSWAKKKKKKGLADVSVQEPCKHSGGLKKGNFKNSSLGIKTHETANEILLWISQVISISWVIEPISVISH